MGGQGINYRSHQGSKTRPEQRKARGVHFGSQLKDTDRRGGKAWRQEDEASSGHFASAVRMQREMSASVQFALIGTLDLSQKAMEWSVSPSCPFWDIPAT